MFIYITRYEFIFSFLRLCFYIGVSYYFYLGCGFARYKENDKTESTAVFVCNFAEVGNVLNKPIYEIGKNVCGNCGPGFKCEDDLKDGTLGALCIEI